MRADSTTAADCRLIVARHSERILDESEATKRRFHFASMALAVEQIRDALGWPKDASHEERFALARKALDDLIQRHADAERRRYDAEVRAERAEFTVRQVREAIFEEDRPR